VRQKKEYRKLIIQANLYFFHVCVKYNHDVSVINRNNLYGAIDLSGSCIFLRYCFDVCVCVYIEFFVRFKSRGFKATHFHSFCDFDFDDLHNPY